jgi:hypothetical protein
MLGATRFARVAAPWLAAATLVACQVIIGIGDLPGLSQKEGTPCQANSDCTAPLVCGFGVCGDLCTSNADCATGATCVFEVDLAGAKTFVCEGAAQANKPCSKPADCVAPMACASDYRCRNLCTSDADCNPEGATLGPKSNVCAQDANGVDYCASPASVSVSSANTNVISAMPPQGAMTTMAVVEPSNGPMIPISAGAVSGSASGSGSGTGASAGSGSASGGGSGSSSGASAGAGSTSGNASGSRSGASTGAGSTGGSGSGSGAGSTSGGASGSSGGTDAGVRTYDGTTGKACTVDADCASPGGPGVNKCGSDFPETFDGVNIQRWATPVCVIPLAAGVGNCDPAPPSDPEGQDPHFCDGPDDISSPGLCVPLNLSAPVSGQGHCLPLCTYATDGTAPTGCVGHNACSSGTYVYNTQTHGPLGIGYCLAACQTKADCSALGSAYECQTDLGNCTLAVVARTKNIGDACTAADNTSGACNCFAFGESPFCSSNCVVGGNACPDGWVCDSGEPKVVPLEEGNFPITKQTPGAAGGCYPPCTAGGSPTQCPGDSTCTSGDVAGPVCQP